MKITEMPCTICWKEIGFTGIVKAIKLSDGTKAQIALCEKHRNLQVSEIIADKEGEGKLTKNSDCLLPDSLPHQDLMEE